MCSCICKLTINYDFNSAFIVSPFSINFRSAVICPIIGSSDVPNMQPVHILCISATCITEIFKIHLSGLIQRT